VQENVRFSRFIFNLSFRLDANKPTCPSKWSEEKLYNPFFRVKEKAVQEFTGVTDPIEVLGKLRAAKDNFRA
jgi:hypothetical protein